MYYVIQCRFSELLFQLCIKNAFFLGPCRNITTMCRKIAFFLGPCRNITIQGHQGQGVPGVPCRAIFSGREEILIFGEIFTSGPWDLLNVIEIKNPFGSLQTNPQADAWWVVLISSLKKMFSWYTLLVTSINTC